MAFGSPQWMYSAGKYEIDQSLKFEDGRSTYLSRTPAADGNRKTWTLSYWIKRGGVADHKSHFGGSLSGTASVGVQIQFDGGTQQLLITDYRAGYNVDWSAKSNMGFRDLSGWYHIVIAVDTTQSTASDRVKLYANGELLSLTTYNAPSQNFDTKFNQNSIQVIGAATDNLTPTNFYEGYMSEINFLDGIVATPANFGETGTYGEWKPKEYSGTYGTNGYYLPMKQDYTVEGFSTVTWRGNGVNGNYIGGTGFKPDFTWIKQRSGVYSHVLADSVRGNGKFMSSSNTGVEDPDITKFQNFATDGFTVGTHAGVNSSGQTYVGWNWDMGADTPTGFSAVTYKGNGGIQNVSGFGFSPDLIWFKRRSTAGSHALIDKVRGSTKWFESSGTQADQTYANNNLNFDTDGVRLDYNGGYNNINQNGTTYVAWGWDMGNTTASNTSGTINSTVMANTTYGQSIVSFTGNGTNGATVGHGLSSAPELVWVTNRDDARNSSIWHTSIPNTHYLHLDQTSASASNTAYWNSTSPTSSVFTLGTSNDINGSSDNMIAYCFHSVSGYSKFGTYTGDATTNHSKSVTLGFRPAFLMVKKTSGTGNWVMVDNVRNPMSNDVDKYVKADTTDAEATQAGELFKFTSTGFTIGANLGDVNANGATYIYMAFAGGMDSISDYNTDGSSDSRVKANTTYGQSIVTYKGKSGAQTIGHGLSSAPEMIIAKNRSSAQEWLVYHHSITDAEQKYLRLDTDGAVADNTFWNDTAPTSSVFSVGDSQPINSGHGNDYVAYCWHSVTGYSKFGSYTGNGSTTGPTVTLGFRPAFVLLKPSSAVDHWNIYDTTRDPQNPINHLLFPNRDNAEGTGQDIEISDTGFQLKTNNTGSNGNGTTYIYMAFADKREYAYWLDQSGNNNDWTSNNLTESDISVDSPTNNFATLNPLGSPSQSGVIGYSEGNLRAVHSGTNLNSSSVATIGLPNSGKYYWEVNIVEGDSHYVGVAHNWHLKQNNNDWIFAQGGWSYRYNGAKYSDGTANSYGDAYDDGDIVGVAVDIDNSKIYFSKNGVWQNSSNPATSTNPAFTNVSGDNLTVNFGEGSSNTHEYIANFGQDSSFAGKKTSQGNQDSNDIGDFYYTPPTGFLTLCTKNLPDVAVTPSENFNTVLWTGDGQSSKAITNTFQPDFTWIKGRDTGTDRHNLYDAIRGATHSLSTDGTDAVITRSTGLTAFTSTGFTVGNHAYVNRNTSSYVSWNWKLNGSGSSNTDGTITSTVSANQDIGVSVLTYTGNGSNSTVGHGLTKAPQHILTKRLDGAASWMSYSETFGPTKTSAFNVGENYYTSSNVYNNTAPTSSVFTIGENAVINTNNGNYVAYCFHSVDGVSRVGEYTGNSNADGPFVYLGFKPAFILLRNGSRTSMTWYMIDNKMGNPENYGSTANKFMQARRTNAEDSPTGLDFLSNGFKIRTTGTGQNYNGETIIYIAFAETPFKNSNAG